VRGEFLYFLGHDHRGKQRAAEHHAHDGILDERIDVGNLVHGEILHGYGNRGLYDQVILVGALRPAEREVEKQLVAALRVIGELVVLGVDVAQLGDQPAGLAVVSRGCLERVYVDAVFAGANLLHERTHLVVQSDQPVGIRPARSSGCGHHREAVEGLFIVRVHPRQDLAVRVVEIPVQIACLENNFIHGRSLSLFLKKKPYPGMMPGTACLIDQCALRTTSPSDPLPMPTALPSSKSRWHSSAYASFTRHTTL